jgi:AraC family transcriptional regulator
MSSTSGPVIALSRTESTPAADFPGQAAQGVRVSSRGLGWEALNFERRDHQPGSRSLVHGGRRHLIFVGLTGGRLVRECQGERREYELNPGCVAVLPALTPISWSWATRISFSLMRLDADFVDRIADSVFGEDARGYRLILAERHWDASLTNIAGVLAREVLSGEPGSRLYAESLAGVLAVHLLRHYAERADGGALVASSAPRETDVVAPSEIRGRNAVQPRAVADAVAFIHDNCTREISLGDIAAAARLSPFHLARVFKQALGVSPHQYLIQLRVNSARWLLSAGSGERSLAELASAVGFADQSHLTRHFKRVLGVTPGQFRS